MYLHSFAAFDSYCQQVVFSFFLLITATFLSKLRSVQQFGRLYCIWQEVVGSLVTHVCCGVSGEVDTSLELLCGLVKEKPTEMAQHAVFVKVQLRKSIYAFARRVESLQFG